MSELDDTTPLTLEERIEIQEWLTSAIIWGLYLDDPARRCEIAAHLNIGIEAAERHQSLPKHVLAALRHQTDALIGIEAMPGPLKSSLRP